MFRMALDCISKRIFSARSARNSCWDTVSFSASIKRELEGANHKGRSIFEYDDLLTLTLLYLETLEKVSISIIRYG